MTLKTCKLHLLITDISSILKYNHTIFHVLFFKLDNLIRSITCTTIKITPFRKLIICVYLFYKRIYKSILLKHNHTIFMYYFSSWIFFLKNTKCISIKLLSLGNSLNVFISLQYNIKIVSIIYLKYFICLSC